MSTGASGSASVIRAIRRWCIITFLAISPSRKPLGSRLYAARSRPMPGFWPRARTKSFNARFIRPWKSRAPARPGQFRLQDYTLTARHARIGLFRHDFQGCDPVARLAQHFEAEIMKGEHLTRLRDGARLIDDKAGDRGGFLVWQIPGHRAVEIADWHRAVNDRGTVGHDAHALHDDIVLVGDIADNFLDNILERDKAHDDAIFIDHEGKMGFAFQERLELILDRGRIRHEPGFERDAFDLEIGGVAAGRIERPQKIPGMQHADDIFRLAAPERQPRIRGGGRLS